MGVLAVLLGAIAAYPWIGYPVLVAALARWVPRTCLVAPAMGEAPQVVVLCVAHDEEQVIAAQVRAVLAQDYPADRLWFLLVMDDCTDATEERYLEAARPAGERFAVLHLPERSGKAGGLATAWAQLTADIVVLTDANTVLGPHTVSALVAPFADATVGAVAGEKRIARADAAAVHEEGEGRYWRFETWLKEHESAAGLSVVADGGCWAVRRHAWDGRTPSSRSDDLWGSTQVVRVGLLTVFAPDAIATEPAALSVADEFRRKRRTALGLTQTLPYVRWLFAAEHGLQAWAFASHKIARLLSPWAVLAHVLALARAGRIGRALAMFEVGGAAACVWAALAPGARPAHVGPARRVARALGYFLIALCASALGAAEGALSSSRPAYWERTPRVRALEPPDGG